MTTLLVVRHGATPANVREPYVLQGKHCASDLVEAGRAQARALGPALRPYRPGTVYASPLGRARQTAQLMTAGWDIPVELEEALAEADTGLWTGLSWPEVRQRWPAEYRAFEEDPERNGYLGGENLAQLRDRVLPAVEGLVARHAGTTLVIVGHGVANRVLLAHWLGLPLRFARRLPQDNGAWNLIEFRNGAPKVRTLNAVAHLGAVTQGRPSGARGPAAA